MRKTYKLAEAEFRRFQRLKPFQHEALSFWKYVAKIRSLDPASMITNGETFTALELGHGKHWCFPIPLMCKKKPSYKEA